MFIGPKSHTFRLLPRLFLFVTLTSFLVGRSERHNEQNFTRTSVLSLNVEYSLSLVSRYALYEDILRSV